MTSRPFAQVDVFSAEPCTDSPLFELPQVVVTPHLGASTAEAQDRAGTDVAASVRLALAGEFTGVYPRESPGGWQLIGHALVNVFDLDRDPPALLVPGARVRFVERS